MRIGLSRSREALLAWVPTNGCRNAEGGTCVGSSKKKQGATRSTVAEIASVRCAPMWDSIVRLFVDFRRKDSIAWDSAIKMMKSIAKAKAAGRNTAFETAIDELMGDGVREGDGQTHRHNTQFTCTHGSSRQV